MLYPPVRLLPFIPCCALAAHGSSKVQLIVYIPRFPIPYDSCENLWRPVSFIRLRLYITSMAILCNLRDIFRFIRFSGIYEMLFTHTIVWACACERQFRHFSPDRWQKTEQIGSSKHSQDQLVSQCDTCESKIRGCNESANQQQQQQLYVHLTNVHAAKIPTVLAKLSLSISISLSLPYSLSFSLSIRLMQRIFNVTLRCFWCCCWCYFILSHLFQSYTRISPSLSRFYGTMCPNKYSYARLLHKDFGIRVWIGKFM